MDAGFNKDPSGRIAYRAWLGKGKNAGRSADGEFVSFSLTRKFQWGQCTRRKADRKAVVARMA